MKRTDARENDQLRRIAIKKKFMKNADGSCLIEVGNTKVICTATVDKNVPMFLKNSGTGWVTAEYGMLPRSTETRIPRNKPSGRTQEIQRLIGRALRSVVDMRLLGERSILVDCDVIQADGGTRTASIVGGFIALSECVHKLCNQGLLGKNCITSYLGAVSIGIFSKEYLLDLNYDEDSAADVDMNVVMKENGEFIEIQGTGEHSGFSEKDLSALLVLAKKGISEIIAMEREILKDTL